MATSRPENCAPPVDPANLSPSRSSEDDAGSSGLSFSFGPDAADSLGPFQIVNPEDIDSDDLYPDRYQAKMRSIIGRGREFLKRDPGNSDLAASVNMLAQIADIRREQQTEAEREWKEYWDKDDDDPSSDYEPNRESDRQGWMDFLQWRESQMSSSRKYPSEPKIDQAEVWKDFDVDKVDKVAKELEDGCKVTKGKNRRRRNKRKEEKEKEGKEPSEVKPEVNDKKKMKKERQRMKKKNGLDKKAPKTPPKKVEEPETEKEESDYDASSEQEEGEQEEIPLELLNWATHKGQRKWK